MVLKCLLHGGILDTVSVHNGEQTNIISYWVQPSLLSVLQFNIYCIQSHTKVYQWRCIFANNFTVVQVLLLSVSRIATILNCVPNLPRKENGWIIVSQGFIVKYSVAKLVWIFNKIIEMVMKKHFKSCVLGGIADQPQPPHNVSTFIWPGPKVAIMNPIILQYSIHSCCHSFLRIINYIN